MEPNDIFSLPMGPHARASYKSRIQALKEFWINPITLDNGAPSENRQIAHLARIQRENILHSEPGSISI